MPKRTEKVFWFLILGCITIAFFPNFVETTEKAKETEARTGLVFLQRAEENYYREKGEYLAVDSPAEITQNLDLSLREVFWDFKVITPQKDKYIIIAVRKGGPFVGHRLEVRN